MQTISFSKPKRAFASNVTDSSFSDPGVSSSAPDGDGVFVCTDEHGRPVDFVKVVIFGVGSNDATCKVRLLGMDGTDGGTWDGEILADLTGTLSTRTGVSGGDITDSERIADAIAVANATEGTHVATKSPGSNLQASAIVDLRGARRLKVVGNKDGATSVNCLVKGVR